MATTIRSYSVSLGLNASDYVKNSLLSRSETNKLRREIEAARTPAENYARSIGLVDKALAVGAINQGTYNRLVEQAGRSMSTAAAATNNLASSLAKGALAYVSFSAIKNFAVDSFKLSAAAESAAISFEVLTGSVEDAQKMVQGLKQLAATTPLSLSDTQSAAKTLLSFNVEASKVLPTLKMLGDITGGNSDRFKMLSLAFAQMTAAGRMMGQDLLQMINAGFNPLQEISRKTGESLVELKKRMEDGAISSEEVASAFASATGEGGKFFGMTDRLAGTAEGRLNILNDKVQELKRAFGELMMSDAFMAQIEGLTSAIFGLNKGVRTLSGGDIKFGRVWGQSGFMHSQTEIDSKKQIESEKKFLEQQLKLRRSGQQTMISDSARISMEAKSAEERKSKDTGGDTMGIGGLIDRGFSSLLEGAGGLQSLLGAFNDGTRMLAYSGIANTKEIINSTKDDPAIKSLEVGTQEAYSYLTQATRDAEKLAREEASRKATLEANAKAQRDKMNEWLGIIAKAAEDNGFKRIR